MHSEETYLYRQIAETIRRQILSGEYKPGDRLPPVREMVGRWNCTIGTVQHAYQELAAQGLVTSRAGQGTHVAGQLPAKDDTPLRRAALVHRAEAFLLEVLTAGFSPADVEDAVRQALDRWRAIAYQADTPAASTLRFAGSHDLAVAWLATHFGELAEGYTLQLNFTGSLGGLIALAEGKADLAGCHLWDAETDTYNLPFVQRLFPGREVALVTLAQRKIGLLVPPGNPRRLEGLADLAQPGLRFANRQPGSGTRVWLDARLHRLGLEGNAILGYGTEKLTHFEVARAVAEDQADAGLGLEAAAQAYGLGFIFLAREPYDLVIPLSIWEQPAIQKLVEWLKGERARRMLAQLAGYETENSGKTMFLSA